MHFNAAKIVYINGKSHLFARILGQVSKIGQFAEGDTSCCGLNVGKSNLHLRIFIEPASTVFTLVRMASQKRFRNTNLNPQLGSRPQEVKRAGTFLFAQNNSRPPKGFQGILRALCLASSALSSPMRLHQSKQVASNVSHPLPYSANVT